MHALRAPGARDDIGGKVPQARRDTLILFCPRAILSVRARIASRSHQRASGFLKVSILGFGACVWACASASAADTLPYAVSVAPTGQGDIDSALSSSSSLAALQKTKAIGSYALVGRIRGDYDRMQTATESFGYYAPTVTITVSVQGAKGAATPSDSRQGNDATLADWLGKLPDGTKLAIRIQTKLGPQFHIGTIGIERAPDAVTKPAPPPGTSPPVVLTAPQAKAFGLKSGSPAVASTVLAAQGNLQQELLEEGHALATVSAPVAYLKPQTQTLDLVFKVNIGPRVNIGTIKFDGLTKMHAAFLRRRLTIAPGELYQPSKIEAARQDLAAVGVFSDVGVHGADQLAPDGTMPLDFTFHEGKRHTVGAEAGYSTDLGGRAGVNWTHHNLFGNAEQLRLAALLTGLGGSAQQGIGYDVYADLQKPDFPGRRQTFDVRVEGVRQLFYSYRQTAILLRGGITRPIGRLWNVSYGLSAEQEKIEQFGTTNDYTILGVPLGGTLDTTHTPTPIDPATHGVRVSLNATPSVSLGGGTSFFTILQASASTYFDLANLGISRKGRSVIAVRGIVASVQGASTFAIPPDQRLYAGGSATVRGFRYQGVGPQFAGTKYAVGGTSMDAGSVEFRQRFLKSFGAAAFLDAGQVGTGSRPGQGTLRVGTGAGVRYYTPIGPVRLDVAVPINRPDRGDKWELYIGLGETF